MKTKIVLAAAIISLFAFGALASDCLIHIHRTSPVELGITCSNGNTPTSLGMEEQTLIVSCGTR